jgi:peroxiredoxin Q/BCP
MAEKGGLSVGKKAPSFTLPDQDGKDVKIDDFRGKWVVLYFYPKDNTPGCTTEAIDFTKNMEDFKKLDSVILGVSPDSQKSHKNFCEKQNLRVTLLSDSEKKVLKQYGAWQLKKMYGRESMGVVRSTYLIDPEGKLSHVWPKVKVKGHVEEVKNKLAELKKAG